LVVCLWLPSLKVIHAGLYYPPSSLKTSLCVQGNRLLYALCSKYQIPHRVTKKWIVAQTPQEIEYLIDIHERASSLGVPTRWLSLEEGRRREPDVRVREGILESERTGIVDSHALMLHLLGAFEDLGGDVALRSPVTRIEPLDDGERGYKIYTGTSSGDSTAITTETLINSAGHGACAINNMVLPPSRHRTPYYSKGTYFSYSGSSLKASTLIYPTHTPSAGGLGTHLTLDLTGRLRFGPDAEWVSSDCDLTPQPHRLAAAILEISKYLPGIDRGALTADYCGVRPKLRPQGAVGKRVGFQDFVVQREEGRKGFVNLLGIESPGLTSSLAIAEMVEGLLYRW
jgi:L-2-hydroxyglutarate oxidase LhgO